MRKLALAVVLAVIVIGAGTFLATFEIEDYRSRIAAEASDALGRRVALDGPIRLGLSLHPTITVDGARIANVEGGSGPEMIRLARLEARIDLLASLGGNVVIERIALKGLDILLEQFADGRDNFTFPATMAGEGDSAPPLPVPRAVLVENASIVYRAGGTSHDFNLNSLAARLDGSMEAFKVQDLRLTLGETRLSGRLEVWRKGPMIRATLAGERLDLRPWQGLPSGAARKTGEKRKKVFSSVPLPLAGLATLDAEIALELATLVTSSLSLQTVKARLTAKDGRLGLGPISAVLAGGRIEASLALDTRGTRPAVSFRLKGDGIDFGELAGAVGAGDFLSAKGSIDLDFTASGRSIAEIAASVEGESKVLIGKGQIDAKTLDLAVGGLTTVLGSLFRKGSEGSVLNCAASRIVFSKGVGTHKLLLVDTGASTVTGEGLIDLANERLEMKITPRPKSVTLNLAVPIKIGGSLASPSVAPDRLATLAKLGSLLGAVFFPPAAILAFDDFGGGEEAKCLKGVAESR